MVCLDPSLTSNREKNSLALGSAFVFGSLADADFIVAHFTTATYFHHHYFSHSIPFAIAFTALCWVVLKLLGRRPAAKWAVLFGAAYSTHLILDYFTEDGSFPFGIPLLWPLTDQHFVAPATIFYSIHRGTWQAIFSPENLQALLMELVVMVPVTLMAVLIARRRLLRGAAAGVPGQENMSTDIS